MSFFVADRVSAGYGKTKIVKSVSFELEQGCLMGILGANGSGKTTLLKAICGILPHTGNCMLEQNVLESLPAKQIAKICSYIPQRSGIGIDISVLDVVLMGFNPQLGILAYPTEQMRQKAREALVQVGLEGKEEVNYMHLSEGQKQLCILARTMVSGSRLLLLDEPESALDFRYRYRMLDLIHSWIAEVKGSAVVTLHDPMLALNYCDKIMLLSNGEILDILSPGKDSLKKMEQRLCEIYGSVTLQICKNRSGKEILTMLKEEDK